MKRDIINGRMRLHRLIIVLGLISLVGLSLILLKVPSPSSSESVVPATEFDHRKGPDAEPQGHDTKPPQEAEKDFPDRPSIPVAGGNYNAHPIATLIEKAESEFKEVRKRQSTTLDDAVKEYRRRYKLPPPPHFDKWFTFAHSKGVQLIDEYDTIYDALLPFWALEPKTIRQRAREAIGFDNAMIGVLIRKGKVTKIDGGTEWQRDATVGMMKKFLQYLPDMDLVFNTHDEPRVLVPDTDLSRMVDSAKNERLPAVLENPTPRNEWSKRPADVNTGDRYEDYRTTRFNRFAHQPTWTNSRASCPANTPARSLEDNPPDDVKSYAVSDLGFIYNTTAFSDICLTPSLRNSFGFFDRPNAFEIVHDLFPVFSQSKLSSFQDILYPSPWYWSGKVPYETKKDVKWESKKDKMYWRGSTTGGFSRSGGWRRQHRQLFVKKINGYDPARILQHENGGPWALQQTPRQDFQDMFDVKFTFIGQCDPDDCAAQQEFFEVVEPAGQQDAWAYKYLVDIDGNAFSGRYYAFLLSNSLIYKLAIFREWHDEWIKPWVHYIPLSLHGDEYVESVRYFALDDGKADAPRLAKQGQEWAQQALRNEDLEVWFFRMLLEYGRVIDDDREKIGFAL